MKNFSVAHVAPARRLPPHAAIFSYSIPAALESTVGVGSIVEIPLKQSLVYGVVMSISSGSNGSRTLKPISKLTYLRLTEAQMSIAISLSTFYYISPALVFHSFIPQVHQRIISPSSEQRIIGGVKTKPGERKHIPSTEYVLYAHNDDARKYIRETLQKTAADRQVAIITPDSTTRNRITEWLAADKMLAGSVFVPRRQKKNEYAEAWEKSRSVRIVAGSFTTVLMPFRSLAHIIVLEAENPQFQSADRSPRYHLADVIAIISKIYDARLLLMGFSPDVALLHRLQSAHAAFKSIKPATSVPIHIISMNEDRPHGDTGPLSKTATDILERPAGRVLLICNRHGEYRSILCCDCGYPATCDFCKKPYVPDETGSSLDCLTCDSKRAMLLACPRCNSVKFAKIGLGVERLARIVRRLVPGKSVTIHSSKHREDDGSLQSADIVVATNAIYSGLNGIFDAAIMVNPDADLNLPHIHAAESLRHYTLKLRQFSRCLYIQTFQPENYAYRTIDSPQDFFREESKWRKAFNAPPFSDTFKITVRDKNAERYRERLRRVERAFAEFPASGPYAHPKKNIYAASFILKMLPTISRSALDAAIAKTYTDAHIEVNPYTFA